MSPRLANTAPRLTLFLHLLLIGGAQAAAMPCADAPLDARWPVLTAHELVRGLVKPVHLTHAGDGSGRLYVVEQGGTVRIIEDGRLSGQLFLDIRSRVTSGGERGLLSIAFDPNFRENRVFYVNYTASQGGLHTRISRFKAASPQHADADSEQIVLRVEQPFANHNGGQIAFGPDGYLYIGMGDGGWANDPYGHGQNTATLLGALLRIDVQRRDKDLAYAIPADNPFVGHAGSRGEIWAYGLRNPWRFSFDRRTGDLWLGDVGQDAKEEIDRIVKGGNYGWNIMEGDICTPSVNARCKRDGLLLPVLAYGRDEGFAVTGGYVYRGTGLPGLCGAYVFGDYGTRRVWGLRMQGNKVVRREKLLTAPDALSSFGEDEQGELYLMGHESGRVYRLAAARDETAPREAAP